MFGPGNQAYKNRKKNGGGSTRTKPLKIEIDAIKKDKENVPLYLQRISDIALTSSDSKLALQACTYLIDRHEGKAKQTNEIAITPRAYSTDDYELMAQVKIAQDRLLLEAGISSYIVGHNGGDEGDNGVGHDYDTNDSESAAILPQSTSIPYRKAGLT